MEIIINCVLFAALIGTGSLSGIAQGTAASKAVGQQAPKVELKYDEKKNFTIASITPMLLEKAPNKLELNVFSLFHGKIPTAESQIMLGFDSGSKKELFRTDRELVFVLDGERVPFDAMRRAHLSCEKTLPSGYGCLYYVEKLDMSISYQTFLRIVNAKKVEGTVGSSKFTLSDSDLDILREFAGRIAPRGEQKF